MESISLSYFFNFTNKAVKQGVTLRKLPALMISDNKSGAIVEQIKEYTRYEDVGLDYGYFSDEYLQAKSYFSFVSKNNTKPEKITILNYSKNNTPSFLVGAKNPNLENLKRLSGYFRVSIDGTIVNCQVDLTSALSIQNIAGLLEQAIVGAEVDTSEQVHVSINTSQINLSPEDGNTQHEQTLEVTTDADFFDFSIDENIAVFNKDTLTITGVSNGETELKLTYKKGNSEVNLTNSVQVKIPVIVSENPAAVNHEVLQDSGKTPTSALNNVKVFFDNISQSLVISSQNSGSESSISFLESPTLGNDISQKLGFTEKEGARIIKGYNGFNTYQDLLNFLSVNNGNYYSIFHNFYLTAEEKMLFADFVNDSNFRFLGILDTDGGVLNSDSYLDSYNSKNGMLFVYQTQNTELAFVAGIIGAIDFSKINGFYNLSFIENEKYSANAVYKVQQLENLEKNNANSFLNIGNLGENVCIFGMGNIKGNLTNSLNTYVGNSYLIFQMQFSFMNMFLEQPILGVRGANNIGVIKSYIDKVLLNSVNNGVILSGAELTDSEKNQMLTIFNDEASIQNLEKQGFFYIIDGVDLDNRIVNLSLAYVSNTNLKRIFVNNYILGA